MLKILLRSYFLSLSFLLLISSLTTFSCSPATHCLSSTLSSIVHHHLILYDVYLTSLMLLAQLPPILYSFWSWFLPPDFPCYTYITCVSHANRGISSKKCQLYKRKVKWLTSLRRRGASGLFLLLLLPPGVWWYLWRVWWGSATPLCVAFWCFVGSPGAAGLLVWQFGGDLFVPTELCFLQTSLFTPPLLTHSFRCLVGMHYLLSSTMIRHFPTNCGW